ncbi:GbsR/MarR family transcriptional regulator [Humibacter ginsenosidimutans]|uniref:MarR family transcriptional regulator n=1 Tax=Humibacter ginsenosidimutans TaxID=2599293 RepID=A0A5B8M7L5_9MICO|nr:MarR family transcriptional regulator [Humibacter ginsenosidimutans]QDZ15592.1 MarR family transcriptional regulator [Humibacter ginsenosidimutans]
MARDEQEARAYVERTAAVLNGAGFPRMPSRVLMTLTAAETPLTAAELAERLHASAAAISGAVRYLQTLAMVNRVSQPGSRRDVYELPQNAWYAATMAEGRIYEAIITMSEAAVDAVGGAASQAGRRVQEMADFMRFVQRRMPELLEEWNVLRGAPGES